MKSIFLTLILLLPLSNTFGQVGIGTTSPDPSSILELQSNNSGFLLPKINLTSTSDVSTEPSPVEGLMIYNLADSCDLKRCLHF